MHINSNVTTSGKPVILVVDDQESLLSMVRCFLTSSGFRVLTAATAAHALRICTRITTPLAALVTDIQMPGMSGVELAVEAGRIRPDMPILLMSGAFTSSDSLIRARIGPRTAFVEKPFSRIVLSSKLRSLLSSTYSQPGILLANQPAA